MHNNFPKPWKTSPNISQLYFLKAQDLMDNSTGSSDDLEFQILSQLSEIRFMKALECDDSKTTTIASATLAYMATLYFATSKYRIAIHICSKVIKNQTHEQGKKENMIASCLLFIDDIARIIGFYLLLSDLHYNRRLFLLDLRLTPQVFARYLIISLNEKRSRRLVVSYDMPTPNFRWIKFQ